MYIITDLDQRSADHCRNITFYCHRSNCSSMKVFSRNFKTVCLCPKPAFRLREIQNQFSESVSDLPNCNQGICTVLYQPAVVWKYCRFIGYCSWLLFITPDCSHSVSYPLSKTYVFLLDITAHSPLLLGRLLQGDLITCL